MLKVWHIQNVPNKPQHYPVASPEEAMRLIDALAKSDLKNPSVGSNAFGLLDESGDEWDDGHGSDILQLMDERSEANGFEPEGAEAGGPCAAHPYFKH